MNANVTSIILGASILLEIVLELKGIKVPTVVYLLSGFAVRHIIGGDTATNTPKTTEVKQNANVTHAPKSDLV